jgi:hypothetical protein
MTTAVVVTTIVTHNSSEEQFLDQLLEQIRDNDRDLLETLDRVGLEGRVTSAILNVGDFLHYAHQWLRYRGPEGTPDAPATQANGGIPTQVCTENMSEAEFMEFILEELDSKQQPAFARLSAADLAALEEEEVGGHLSQHPFLY